jgi:protein-S-isoprenylcysteine O-methyltransferase Ste14
MMTKLGHVLFRFRTSLSPLLLLLLFLPGPRVLADPLLAAILGLAVAALGQTIRAATIGLQYIVRGGRGHRVYADDLVTGGLFAHVRNPLYVGKFFMAVGVGIATNSWSACVALCAAYGLMYHAVVLAEEEYLRGKFGAAFDDYCAHVPRWVPRLRGLRSTFAQARFDWARVLDKEYSAPLGWILPITVIALYNLRGGSELGGGQTLLLALLAGTIVFWLGAGWVKKSRRARRAGTRARVS